MSDIAQSNHLEEVGLNAFQIDMSRSASIRLISLPSTL